MNLIYLFLSQDVHLGLLSTVASCICIRTTSFEEVLQVLCITNKMLIIVGCCVMDPVPRCGLHTCDLFDIHVYTFICHHNSLAKTNYKKWYKCP